LAAGLSSAASCNRVPTGSSEEATVSHLNGPLVKSAFFTKPSTSVQKPSARSSSFTQVRVILILTAISWCQHRGCGQSGGSSSISWSSPRAVCCRLI